MNQKTKSGLKAAGATALIGGSILLTIGNPVAWAALGVAVIQIGKTAYRNAKYNNDRRFDDQEKIE